MDDLPPLYFKNLPFIQHRVILQQLLFIILPRGKHHTVPDWLQ